MTYIKQAIQELKPCPFCGGTEIELSCGMPDREGIPKQMNCTECGASGPWDYATEESTEQQVKDWNTRPTPDLTERIEAAAEEIAKQADEVWPSLRCDNCGSFVLLRNIPEDGYDCRGCSNFTRTPDEVIGITKIDLEKLATAIIRRHLEVK